MILSIQIPGNKRIPAERLRMNSRLFSGLCFMNRKHGLSGTILYDLWATIKNRCYNKNDHIYPRYGERGVVMCDEWLNNPEAFIEWAKNNGWKKGLQIDKDIIAMKLGVEPLLYSPDRCQFVTPTVNGSATRKSRFITYNGQTKTLIEWSRELKIPSSTILIRLDNLGYTVEQALTKKDNRLGYSGCRNVKRVFEYNGKSQSIPKWSKEVGISSNTLNMRITEFGWSIEKALTTPIGQHKFKKK